MFCFSSSVSALIQTRSATEQGSWSQLRTKAKLSGAGHLSGAAQESWAILLPGTGCGTAIDTCPNFWEPHYAQLETGLFLRCYHLLKSRRSLSFSYPWKFSLELALQASQGGEELRLN